MPQFLFVVEVPPIPANSYGMLESNDWSQFRHAADTKIKTAKSAVRLQPNAWLLPAEKTLPLLTELAALAQNHSLSYSVVLIPDGAVTLALDVKPTP